MSHANLSGGSSGGSGIQTITTDSGTATGAANNANLNGDSSTMQTSATGDTATITATDNFKATGFHAWNGALIEKGSTTVTSNGTVITFSVEKSGGGDLTAIFSDGYYAWDCTPADTVTLTAGTDTSPQLNYVYFLQSTKTLTASTSNWPNAEHVRVATVLCQSAASLQTDGPYKHHQWLDDTTETDNQGHITDLSFWIRSQPATWETGVAQTFTITPNVGTPDNVIIETTSGVILQLHENAWPAFTGTPDIYVTNDSGTPYTKVTDLNALLTDSTGASMSGRYFSLVIWGAVNQNSGDCKLYCNLPSGSYNNQASLEADESKFAVYTIPKAFDGVGFLIAEWKLRHTTASGGTWTSIDEIDLRGLFPALTAGGSSAITTEFADSSFRIYDNTDVTKELAFEVSGITTATTRTITMADQNINLTPTTGTYQGSDADLTALAALATTGLVARTGAASYALRTLTGPAAGLTVTNGDGVSGNPTLALADDLAAVEALSGTGVVTRTGANTWATNTIADRSIVAGDAGGAVQGIGPLSDGEIIIGATGGDPAPGSLASSGGTIVFTPGTNTINADCASATTTQAGVQETATDAEAVAVTATDKFITPSNLAAVFASPPALGSTASAAVSSTTLSSVVTSATTNAPITVQTIEANTSGTAANGIGPRQVWRSEDGSGGLQDIGYIDCIEDDVTAASEDASFRISAIAGGSVSEVLRLSSSGISTNGGTDFFKYSSGTWTPALSRTGITFGYSVQEGEYRKCGEICAFSAKINLSSATGSGSGNLTITGFPFTAHDGTSVDQVIPVIHNNTSVTSGNQFIIALPDGTSTALHGLWQPSGTPDYAITPSGTASIFFGNTYITNT